MVAKLQLWINNENNYGLGSLQHEELSIRNGEKLWGRGLRVLIHSERRCSHVHRVLSDHARSQCEKHYYKISQWVSTRSQNHPWATAQDKSPDIRTWLPGKDNDKHCTWTSLQVALCIARTFRLLSQNCMRHHTAVDNSPAYLGRGVFTLASCYAPISITRENCTVSGKMQTGPERGSLDLTVAHLTFSAGSSWIS